MEYDNDRDPTPGELDAIEAEWPLIEAELNALDSFLRTLMLDGRLCELDRRRARRAGRRALDTLTDPPTRPRADLVEVALSRDCAYGCKVMRCRSCGAETVLHQAAYGCRLGVAA